MENKIKTKISTLEPLQFELVNESHLHAGHLPGHHTESHFKLIMVSAKFSGLTRVQRQRLVYDLLDEEFKTGLHALTMKLSAPDDIT